MVPGGHGWSHAGGHGWSQGAMDGPRGSWTVPGGHGWSQGVIYGLRRPHTYRAIPFKNDTPPVDKVAGCVPWTEIMPSTPCNRGQYTEICGNLQKMYGDLQQNTETRQIPHRTN